MTKINQYSFKIFKLTFKIQTNTQVHGTEKNQANICFQKIKKQIFFSFLLVCEEATMQGPGRRLRKPDNIIQSQNFEVQSSPKNFK